jgi:acyl dehydratase
MTYFEDFSVGQRMRHARGKTVTDVEVETLCHLVMNTAAGHFDEHAMSASPFGRRIAFGGITAAIVIGLAMEDTAEEAVEEVGLDAVRFRTPVVVGDTLYALTEVIAIDDVAGIVTFRHWGLNQKGDVVFEGDRRVRLPRRR